LAAIRPSPVFCQASGSWPGRGGSGRNLAISARLRWRGAAEGQRPRFALVLYNLAKQRNVGTLVRSASAFGVSVVVVVGERKKGMVFFGAQGTDKHVKFVYVDSKVPLNAYLDAQEASELSEHDRYMGLFAKNVRSHADQLSAKQYWKADEATPEFVVLFMPMATAMAPASRRAPSQLRPIPHKNAPKTTGRSGPWGKKKSR